ncbi:DedA family protein [Paenibacillus alvei]|uniref:DedA family protein n=1 Tax=Paenibacillus alvei TaxID=44250 RepID=A0ABT4H524_PAEAL|nr:MULTISPECIES: DedA family protein [Paenibacillus]EJW17716.1 putative membrane protein YbfM [Paenibacillus alvei DSM 29]MCY7486742.1 DedA family protein [Paenibacillus alvei]MCY9540684.1 DedA family protein [Paenibacillus alvei]MCY9707085.1 DedA family protein [Paenibacillus alvei]MCY9735189.1 DedA family protein [Paenibacillus alvei]
MHTVMWALSHYGYIALFMLLALGIIGIPVPDETLMVFVGSLTVNGPFQYIPAFAVCLAGSMTGMFISYMVGRKVGKPLLDRYGKKLKLTPQRIERTEEWFQKYGGWSIVFGYFVPGLRHLTCYFAGMSRMRWTTYLFAAGSGALVWVTTFLTLGHIVGNHWREAVRWLHSKGNPILFGGIAVLAVGGTIVYFVIRYRLRTKRTP